MKKCPTCDKEYPDSMRFCQSDGTVLIEKVDDAPADPYKTIVSNQNDIAAAIPPLDPFKTIVANSAESDEDDLLQLPDEAGAANTMSVSQDAPKPGKTEDAAPLDLPPASYAPSAPLIEPKPKNSLSDSTPTSSPKLGEPSVNPPSFGDSSAPKPPSIIADASETEATAIIDKKDIPPSPASPFDAKPLPNDFSSKSPYGNQDSRPIPSPFDLSMPPGYQPPPITPFDEPKPPAPDFSKQSPFAPPTPFGQAEPFNQPLQQAEWTPPPAPDSNWQNQEIGANTPFQPPVAAAGQNQTLAIVSLVCGILSLLCCFSIITGPAGIITGFMAKNKADQEPAQYGGRGMALAGMITGGIGTVIGILVIILQILGAFAGRF